MILKTGETFPSLGIHNVKSANANDLSFESTQQDYYLLRSTPQSVKPRSYATVVVCTALQLSWSYLHNNTSS